MKTLDNTNIEDAKKATSDIKIVGDGDAWRLLGKASSQKEGWMKSTKAMEIRFVGVLVQVTTQQLNPEGNYAVAEAVTFVPGVFIGELRADGGRDLLAIDA